MNIFSRSIAGRGSSTRRARRLFLIVAIAASPALAATFGHAAGSNEPLTVTTMDNGNGYLDAIRLTFGAALDQTQTPKVSSGPGDPGFRVEGYTIKGFAYPGSQTLDILLNEGALPDTAARPGVWYVPGDGGAHIMTPLRQEIAPIDGRQATDGAGPVLTSVTANDLPAGGAGLFASNGEEMIFTFSEAVTLAGQTKSDRWYNFERVIRFENIASESGGTCAVDGPTVTTAGTVDYNFPQPPAASTTAPSIFVTSDPHVLHVKMQSGHAQSNRRVPGIPLGCAVGVDPDLADRSLLTDAASNVARGMDLQTEKLRINPVDAKIVVTRTLDGIDGAAPDGTLDAIEITFDQNLDADTIDQSYQVTAGGTTATATPRIGGNANQLLLDLSDVQWSTGVRPRVVYAKPSSCAPGGGTGLKALVPSPGWRTCAQSFDLTVFDGAAPVALSAATKDEDLNGKIDGVAVTFTEAIAGHLAPSAWKVNDASITTVVTSPEPDQHKVTITFPESVAETTPNPIVSYARVRSGGGLFANPAGSHDFGNNEVVSFSMAAIDGVQPRIETAEQFDADGDGNIDLVTLTYSEPVEDPSDLSGLTVGGRSVTLVAPQGDDAADDAVLTLSVAGLSGTDPKQIEAAAPGIKDVVGNQALEQTLEATDDMDRAAPRATLTVLPSAPIPAGESTIQLSYSEPMDTAIEPTITFPTEQGDKPVTSVGWSEDARSWEGTVTIVEGDCSVSAGCSVTVGAADAADPASNLQSAVEFATKIDTVAPTAPVLGSLSRTFTSGGSAPDGYLNTSVRNVTLNASVISGEATGGVATLLLDGEPLDGATDATVADADDSVAAATSFASTDEFQAAIAEGAHSFGLELCDAAGNCSVSATTIDVTADYTPVSLALTSPTGGEKVTHGSTVGITWDGDETALDLDHIEIAATTDGSTWTTLTDTVITADGSYEWTTPEWVHTTKARVRAAAVDAAGNRAWATSGAFTIEVPATFSDVPQSYWAFQSIEALYAAEVTTGCSGGKFCPGRDVNRAQMAVFLIRALDEEGNLGTYKGSFSDVPETHWAALHIERLAELGVTSGCGGGKFCPGRDVNRAQMAVFLIRALEEEGNLGTYQGRFSDVGASNWAALHIERLAELEVTTGCDATRFCPGRDVSRAQMAVFLVRAFDF